MSEETSEATSYKRIILELGTGNDLYGEDYTKAGVRAVRDALHHSSLSLFRSLGLDRDRMRVRVTIGVQHPERIDFATIAREIPYGEVRVVAVLGGLDVEDEDAGGVSVIATAGVAAYLELPEGRFTLGADEPGPRR